MLRALTHPPGDHLDHDAATDFSRRRIEASAYKIGYRCGFAMETSEGKEGKILSLKH